MINALVTLIDPLELAGSRALRFVIMFVVLWSATGLLALAWWICKKSLSERALPYPVVGDPQVHSFEENLIKGVQQVSCMISSLSCL